MNYNFKKAACVCVVASLGLTAPAYTFFDNTTDYSGNLIQIVNGLQIGNEVTLGGGLYLTNFQFEYYSTNSILNSALGVDIRFYTNSGPLVGAGYPSPGTLIYDSGWYNNSSGTEIPTGTKDLAYGNSDLYMGSLGGVNLNTGFPGNFLPIDFTFTITFTNVGTDAIYLPLANNTLGKNYGTYWQYNNGLSQWALLTNTVPANFVVKFEGVPEPSMLGLATIGSALLLGISRLKRKV